MRRLLRASCLSLFILAGLPCAARASMDSYPTARLRMLDKVTARTSTFDVRIDTTVRFGPLYIRPRACRKASPLEAPESAAFLQIWAVTPKQDAHWIFSGWMFSSSPALSSMDSPIYDVWVLDCIGDMAGQGADGQIGFTSGQDGLAPGGMHTQVSFMSGQISYASGQIHFMSTGTDTGGQIGATSSSIGFASSGALTPPAQPPAQSPQISPYQGATPAPSPEEDDDRQGVMPPYEPQPDQPQPDQPQDREPEPSVQDPVY
jgi:hypothetical protein